MKQTKQSQADDEIVSAVYSDGWGAARCCYWWYDLVSRKSGRRTNVGSISG